MRGHARRRRLAGAIGAMALAATAALAAPAAAAPPEPVLPGFQDVALVSGVPAPVAVRFAPNGHILVADKGGRVFAFERPHDPSPRVVVDLREEVHDFWDRGLLGMALDPGFAINRRLYLLYTRNQAIGDPRMPRWPDDCPSPPGATEDGCVVSGRLVRVTLNELGTAGSVEPVIEEEWCQQFPSHSVGTVAFGPDGMLYAGAGDGAMWEPGDYGQHGNPCGDPGDGSLAGAEGGSLRAQDLRTAGDPVGLSGAIVRVDPGSTNDPADRRIVAYGMRNPFRFTFRPGTSELWIGDVGNNSWEEINRVDAADPAVPNLGWPCWERTAKVPVFSEADLCKALYADGSATPPRFAYPHRAPAVAGGDGCEPEAEWAGSSLSGIAFRGSGGWPAEFDGALFFADYSRNCIWIARAGAGGQPDFSTVRAFAAGARGTGVVDLQVDPRGDLVYAYLDPFDPSRSTVRRIRSSANNAAPTAALAASPTDGPTPLAVRLDASASADADADPLEFDWDLDGDGAFGDAAGPAVEHTYATGRQVTARVRVRDPFGETDEAEVTISPDNTAPRATMIEPAAGTSWTANETIRLRGSAVDADGDDVTLAWSVVLQHCEAGGACHGHPLVHDLAGAEREFTAPEHPQPSHLTVRLTATDARGLTHSVTRDLPQRTLAGGPEATPAGEPAGAAPGGAIAAPRPGDTSRPAVRVSGARVQRLASGRLRLRATCPREPCRATVTPRLRDGGRSASALAAKTRVLAAGRAVTVTLVLPPARRRALAAALRRGRSVTARLEVVATDLAGNRSAPRRLTIRLVP
jgi:glucose/arabinose dehydrogenase